jgi:hypothetical protein
MRGSGPGGRDDPCVPAWLTQHHLLTAGAQRRRAPTSTMLFEAVSSEREHRLSAAAIALSWRCASLAPLFNHRDLGGCSYCPLRPREGAGGPYRPSRALSSA